MYSIAVKEQKEQYYVNTNSTPVLDKVILKRMLYKTLNK